MLLDDIVATMMTSYPGRVVFLGKETEEEDEQTQIEYHQTYFMCHRIQSIISATTHYDFAMKTEKQKKKCFVNFDANQRVLPSATCVRCTAKTDYILISMHEHRTIERCNNGQFLCVSTVCRRHDGIELTNINRSECSSTSACIKSD